MSADDTALDEALRKLISTGSGIATANVIPGNDDGSRPSGLYATLLVIEEPVRGGPDSTVDADGNTVTCQQVRATYSLQFFRDGARLAARRFQAWAQSQVGIAAVEDASHELAAIIEGGQRVTAFRLVQPFGPERLDVPVADKWEARQLINLMVDYELVTTGVIHTLAVREGTITRDADGAVISERVTHG